MNRASKSLGSKTGFSLIEMLLVLGLVGLFLGTILVNVTSMFRGSAMDEIEGTLWIAIDKAKQKAVFQQRRVVLSFDKDSVALIMSSGNARERFDLRQEEEGEIRVVFNEKLPDNARYLIGGEVVTKREIERVVFFPDGTCTPFLVTIEFGDWKNVFEIDPWTGNQIVPEERAL